ncbi:Glucose-methanol-choline (Gmc) oxidoreductase [Pleurostoma richardsiae]|uniref:Glucose-methanol-choline (Gmc) oxidoreductase n=1 Tax=Pleurostoma richardsiae TaxID=41990 RepID=A0AA38VJ51_9PEZI|nr:Glucose-methanol-choline (Gmc) oxidoreductase [Pleurostoma richardsiae]
MADALARYDFIVVGAGPAGCTIASTLAKTKARPQVLLVEAGDDNDDVNLRVDGNKYVQMLTPSLEWGYKSLPQASLANREIRLARGKGLGGSSAVNFTVWNIGPRDDMEEMARLTGDDAWKWEKAQERWKKLENFHAKKGEIPEGMEQYLDPRPENHGTTGPLHIGFPYEWDYEVTAMMDIWRANGFAINPDASNGDPLGLSVFPLTSYRGVRVTSADLLAAAPDNLHILTRAHVHRVLIEDGRAKGVMLVDGEKLYALKEVIISAGSLDSPKILMHSGIGPADQLSKFQIPMVHENPSVGKNYRDHYHVMMKFAWADHMSKRPAFFRDKLAQKAAMREWQLYRTGPYANLGCAMAIGFFKSDATLQSPEFALLPDAEKERLLAPTIPSYEVCWNCTAVDYYIAPDAAPAIATVTVFLQNSQGLGEVRLQSSNPSVPLEFDPAYLEHPFDKRVAIEATREVLKVVQSPEFQKNNVGYLCVPKSDSEEDILEFWQQELASTWHMSCTCKMGQSEKGDNAVVDTDLKVFGVKGLRVADMSVMPILLSAHTQAAAYQVGMVGAEKVISEYGLDK